MLILKTKDFQEVCKTILLAVDNNAANLELKASNNILYLNLTDRETYVSVKFNIDSNIEFRVVVDALLFLNLISGITAEEFELDTTDKIVKIKAGKSNYKLAIIYENDTIIDLPVIQISNKTVEMSISNDILKSILNVNSRELSKIKNLDVNELQRLYYITETGCFTFTTGACLNEFKLEKPIQLLLSEKIVKLFKLFNEDVHFSFGHDTAADNTRQDKVSFETDNIYVAALVISNDDLLNRIQGPCTATKNFINEQYTNNLVVSASSLSNAISRLMLFTKNSIDKANMRYIPATIELHQGEIIIKDKLENEEVVAIDNASVVTEGYSMIINLADLKLAIETYKNEHITINCGNHRSVVISCGQINNLLPEGKNN